MSKFAQALLIALATIPAGVGMLEAAPAHAQSEIPQEVADELIAADRAFAAAAANVDTVAALSAMFHDDVIMPLPNGSFARGRTAAVEALRGNPFNLASRAEWAPVRGGISADGQHGFTFGFMTLHGNDGEVRLAKYLGYWVRTPQGWRVAAYKRAARPEGEISTEMMAPSLPARLDPVTAEATVVDRHRESLRDAEQDFSDEAQRIGMGPAFGANGRADAMNMGQGPNFTIGAQNIGGSDTAPAPVYWGADQALVASSGDLGVTFGVIRPNAGTNDGRPSASSFFTIWRRENVDDRWLYIAE